MRVLVVGSITRDTNVFDGVADHAWGGTALYAARTYAQFGVAVRLVSRLASDDQPLIAALLPGVELLAQSSPVTTTFENRYGADESRAQRVTAIAQPIDYRAEYFDGVDWLHLGPLHPDDLHDSWLHDRTGVRATADPARTELLGFPVTGTIREQFQTVTLMPFPALRARGVWLMVSEEQTRYQMLRSSIEEAGMSVTYGVVPGDGDWERLDFVHQTLLPHAMVRAITSAMAS